MWLLTFFAVICVATQSANSKRFGSTERCFEEAEDEYINCTSVPDRPDACDCGPRDPCYIKMVIRKVGTEYRINGADREPGPTLIMKHNATVVVDVFNENDDETSIHWHGMHQKYIPWMDGVGYITEWPIPGHGKHRYIFKAHPYGTHWYHSHIGEQRDHGLYGALIVREPTGILRKLPNFIDDPSKYTITLREFGVDINIQVPSIDVENRRACSPDGSLALGNFQKFGLMLNGKKTSDDETEVNIDLETFDLEPGKTYRFRLIGSMEEQPVLFSIDDYKLLVIASEGFLVEPFETDILNIHAGERYDFLVTTAPTGPVSFHVRTETAVVDCENLSRSKKVGLWRFRNGDVHVKREIPEQPYKRHKGEERCNVSNPCIVLNCAFVARSDQECHYVTELTALVSAPDADVPGTIDQEVFFSFAFNVGPSVNSKSFTLPSTPLQVTDYDHSAVCEYDQLCNSSEHCVQIADIPNDKKNIRFVFSTPSVPHPIHLHGHSFFVAKIGITDQDLEPHECGNRMKWKPGREPSDTLATSKTIRKDTLTVPEDKYAVVEFRADNPGYWFMHCHIDPHLIGGMAAVIREKKSLQNPPPEELEVQQEKFCWTVEEFEEKLLEGSEMYNSFEQKVERKKVRKLSQESERKKHFESLKSLHRPFTSNKKFSGQHNDNFLRKLRDMPGFKAFRKQQLAEKNSKWKNFMENF